MASPCWICRTQADGLEDALVAPLLSHLTAKNKVRDCSSQCTELRTRSRRASKGARRPQAPTNSSLLDSRQPSSTEVLMRVIGLVFVLAVGLQRRRRWQALSSHLARARPVDRSLTILDEGRIDADGPPV
jgi:hypothetical protein